VGFEPYGAEVVSCDQVHIGIQGGGEAEQRNGGLGAALLDALDLTYRHSRPPSEVGSTEAAGTALVIDALAEGKGLADRDPLPILGLISQADPAGVVAGHHTCLP
jgi:hypothetical protein